MATWTELVLAVEFRADTPADILDWIQYLVNPDLVTADKPLKRPDHPLFKQRTENAPLYLDLFHGESTAFAGESVLRFAKQDTSGQWHLTVRSAVRNYQREIEALLLFLMPYVEARGYAGYFRYQTEEHPSLVYYPEPGKLVVLDKIGELITAVNGSVKPLLDSKE